MWNRTILDRDRTVSMHIVWSGNGECCDRSIECRDLCVMWNRTILDRDRTVSMHIVWSRDSEQHDRSIGSS
jgi:hypothetical protein